MVRQNINIKHAIELKEKNRFYHKQLFYLFKYIENVWIDVLFGFSNLDGFAWRWYNHYFIIFQNFIIFQKDDLFYSRCQKVCILIKTRAIKIGMPIMYATRSFSLSFYELNLNIVSFLCVYGKTKFFHWKNLHNKYIRKVTKWKWMGKSFLCGIRWTVLYVSL